MRRIINKHTFFHYLVTVLVYFVKGMIGEIMWILIGLGGYFIFQTKRSPFDLVFGLPLVAISVGYISNWILSELLVVFSPTYNREVCVICKS